MSLVVVDLGSGVPYAEGMARMRAAMDVVDETGPVLLLQEHAAVITVTRQGGTSWVTSSRDVVEAAGIELVETDRGGDVTFHGPGQLVGYPVCRLPERESLDGRVDLLGYVRALEGAMLRTCKALGLEGCHTKEKMTGVWVASDASAPADTWSDDEGAEKIVAIGVGVRRGVTRHGFALNVTTALESFTEHIVPCGLEGRGVTSLERQLEQAPSMDEVKRVAALEVEAALTEFFAGGGVSAPDLPLFESHAAE